MMRGCVSVQMLISLQDEIVDAEASQKFYRGLKIRDKQLKTYPGFPYMSPSVRSAKKKHSRM